MGIHLMPRKQMPPEMGVFFCPPAGRIAPKCPYKCPYMPAYLFRAPAQMPLCVCKCPYVCPASAGGGKCPYLSGGGNNPLVFDIPNI